MPFVLDGRRDDGGLDELTHQPADLPGKAHVRLEFRHLLGADRGHVERVDDGAGEQEVCHLLGHLQGHLLLSLDRRGAQMRRRHDLRQPEQRAGARRLLGEHVQRRAGDVSGLDRRLEIVL